MYYHNFIFLYWDNGFMPQKHPRIRDFVLFKFESGKISLGWSSLNSRISLDNVIFGLCSSGLYLQIYKNVSNHVRRIKRRLIPG